MRPTLLLAALIGLSLVPDAPAQESAPQSQPAITPSKPILRFLDKLEAATADDHFVGLAFGIVEGGRTVAKRTYGTRRAGGKAPITNDTIFRIASVSKGFAGTLAALLAHEGKISLDAPITRYAPGFALSRTDQTRRLTIEAILSHRTGLPPYAYDNLLEAGRSRAHILERLQEVPLGCDVKTCYTYQNVAFSLVEPVIERATGKPYAEALGEALFTPLDMTNAGVGLDQLKSTGNWAEPHIRDRRRKSWRTISDRPAYYRVPSAGGVNASLNDMLNWLKAQLGHRPDILPEPALALAHRSRVNSVNETAKQRWLRRRVRRTGYALGWRVYAYAGETLIIHSGGLRGYHAQIGFLPEKDIGFVALWNNNGSRRGWRLMPTLLDEVLGLPERDWLRIESSS